MLSVCLRLYQSKLQDQGEQDIINMKKMKFDPYSDLVDQALYQFSGNSVNTQYPYSHTEKDEIPQMMKSSSL